MPVTQGDVARLAGVAPRTVSNVVNDFPYVSESVRLRVHAAIEQLGYRPNRAAQNLRRGRSGTIALMLPELDVGYFGEIGRLLVEQAEARGYTVLIAQSLGERKRELEVLGKFAGQQPDGIVLSPISIGRDEIDVHTAGTPTVLLGEHLLGGDDAHVAIDNVAATRLAVDHLVENGRRAIGFIGQTADGRLEMADLRVRGYHQALRQAGLAPDPRLVQAVTGYHREHGYDAATAMLATGAPLDGIFCATDLLALGAMRALTDARIAIPEQVAVVGFDDLDDAQYSVPRLTSLSPDKDWIATTALDILIARIDGNEPPERDVSHRNFHLEIRESSVARAR